MSPRECSILSVTCYGHFMSHFNMLLFPAVLLPLSVHLEMGFVQAEFGCSGVCFSLALISSLLVCTIILLNRYRKIVSVS